MDPRPVGRFRYWEFTIPNYSGTMPSFDPALMDYMAFGIDPVGEQGPKMCGYIEFITCVRQPFATISRVEPSSEAKFKQRKSIQSGNPKPK